MRDNFTDTVKTVLAKRVGYHCSQPDCGALTCGPGSNPSKSVSVGDAAHITAAAPGGPRYDASLTADQRKAATNGIWLCKIHAKLVDNDANRYPAPLLLAWKAQAEAKADGLVGKPQAEAPTLASLNQGMATLLMQVQALTSSSNVIDSELDEVKREVETHKYDGARYLVERCLTRHNGTMTNQQRCRAKTLLANTHIAHGNGHLAGPLLLEAAELQPGDEKAQVNKIVGYEMLPDSAHAHEAAEALRLQRPHSALVAAAWVRTAPLSITGEQLEKEAGNFAAGEADVAIALALALSLRGCLQETERFARLAVTLKPESPQGWLMLAQSFHKRAAELFPDSRRKSLLDEAITHYGRTIDLCKAQDQRYLWGCACINRANILESNGRGAEAEEDFREALRLSPNDVDVVTRYAAFLFLQQRHDDAFRQAQKAVDLTGSSAVRHFLAVVRFDRKKPNDREEAVAIWRQIVAEGPSDIYCRSLEYALLGHCEFGQYAEARELLAGVPADAIPQAMRLSNEARIALSAGDTATALTLAKSAFGSVTDDLPKPDRWRLALVLVRLGLAAEAIPLLNSARRPGELDDLTRCIIDCATRTENHDLLLQILGELRASGQIDNQLRHFEFDVLAQYDARAAGELIREYLSAGQEDRLARLKLAYFGRQCEEPSWGTTDLNEFPAAGDVDPSTGHAVLSVLIQEGRTLDALRFGYDLLRTHPTDADANHAYLTLFFECDTDEWPLTVQGAVKKDTAVCYREVGTTDERWVIVEDDKPNSLLDEYPSTHSLVSRMLELQRGDTFVLVEGIKERRAEVIAVKSKYVFRFERCRDEYQTTFQERKDFQMVRVISKDEDGTEKADFTPIFAEIDRRNERVTKIFEAYRTKPFPTHVLACFLGNDIFETLDGISSQGLDICVWPGDTEATVLPKKKTLVLDITALFALGRLRFLERLTHLKDVKFLVTQGTFDQLRNLAVDNPRLRARAHLVSAGEGQYAWVEIPEEAMQENMTFRCSLVTWVRQHCEIVGCREFARVLPERRRQLIERFGRFGAESACVATRTGHILWTDEHILGACAKEWLNLNQRTWTQAVLRSLVVSKVFSEDVYNLACAQLIELGHAGVQYDSAVLALVAERANWSLANRRFAQLLDSLAGANPNTNISAKFLCRMFCVVPQVELQRAVMWAVLDRMKTRKLAVSLFTALIPLLDGKFAYRTAQGFLEAWLRRPGAPVV